MPYQKRWNLMRTEINSVIVENAYCLLIEATPAARSIVTGLPFPAIFIKPSPTDARAWFQVPYTEGVDMALQELVDVVADIRMNRPNFGQLELFAKESRDD